MWEYSVSVRFAHLEGSINAKSCEVLGSSLDFRHFQYGRDWVSPFLKKKITEFMSD